MAALPVRPTVTLSVVIPTRTEKEGLEAYARLPPGADEVILQIGDPCHPSHLRNLGARKARGKLLLFLDDDVLVRGDLLWLEQHVRAGEWYVPTLEDATGDRNTKWVCATSNTAAKLGLHTATIGAFVAIRPRLLERAGGWPMRMSEDVGLGRRLGALGATLRVAPLTATFLRPCPTWGKTLERYPNWAYFPFPSDTPHRILFPTGSRIAQGEALKGPTLTISYPGT